MIRRLNIFVEGHTEEAFVGELLAPHYRERTGLYITPMLLETSKGFKGGVASYESVKRQLARKCKEDATAFLTTMIDLYALPSSFPSRLHPAYQGWTGRQKAAAIEAAMAQDIGFPGRFRPNLMVHEYEALLFSSTDGFEYCNPAPGVVQALGAIVRGFATPEDINHGPSTAPSKRILSLMPEYQKIVHGPLISCEIGLDTMRARCPHFNDWLSWIDSL